MTARALAACCLTLAIACGGAADANKDGIADGVKTPDSVSLVAPSTPVGTLSGTVLTTRLAALGDASVSLNLGGPADLQDKLLQTTTDPAGNFAFRDLPAGSNAQLSITKPGFSTAHAVVFVPAAAGNFPINDANGNAGIFALAELNGTLKVRVVTRSGKPAHQAKATLEVTPATSRFDQFGATVYGAGQGAVVVDGTADDTGVIEFKDVPTPIEQQRLNGQYTVSVAAFDDDGDQLPDFRGSVQLFSAQSLTENPTMRVITLESVGASTPITLTASNVDSIITNYGPGSPVSPPARNFVAPADALYFVFDQPVLEASIFVKVTDETGLNTIATNRTLKSGAMLSVQFMAPLEVGKEYNVAVRAISAGNGSLLSRSGYFFGADPTTPKTFASPVVSFKDLPPTNAGSNLNQGDRVVVTFNQPLKLISGADVELFFDLDLNGTGRKDDAVGEKGFATGFKLIANEPLSEPASTFANLPSGYTTRYEFIYANPNGMGVPYTSVPLTTGIVVGFSRLATSTGGYQTIWGVSVETDVATSLTAP